MLNLINSKTTYQKNFYMKVSKKDLIYPLVRSIYENTMQR